MCDCDLIQTNRLLTDNLVFAESLDLGQATVIGLSLPTGALILAKLKNC